MSIVMTGMMMAAAAAAAAQANASSQASTGAAGGTHAAHAPASAPTAAPASGTPAPPMAVIDERTVMRDEPNPHGKIGMSTAYRISDAVPQPRTMEFRKRVLHVGSAIGLHPIAHDEVYYVLSGEGEVESDGVKQALKPGMAAYLYTGAQVGIRQVGKEPLALIISYPVVK
jgi:mannose-6-phosphate isomerase-like protein (cupin superfamily)